ncbi:hypothetical protein LAD12857_09740 [Lacrimispora amygdalina]|uniref:Uncharacterized protein n=1 Tax=Lacrimispora amygdalina TaxID=253257 RepID=A0ABQ5M273_9FIRM
MLGRISDEYKNQIFFGAQEKIIFPVFLEQSVCGAYGEGAGEEDGISVFSH